MATCASTPSKKRPLGVIPNEFIVPARVQVQRIMPVWMAKMRWLVLRGSKTPILAVYRHVSASVKDENPIRVMLLGADTSIRAAGEKSIVIVSSRVRRNDSWTLGFQTSSQRRRMYELLKMWIQLSAFLQSLANFESISKSHNSIVYRCHDRVENQRFYALKRVNRVKCWNEVEITERLANLEPLQPYLARYLFMFEDAKDNSVTIAMKFYNGGTLSDQIREFGPVSESTARTVMASLCLALYLLHQNNILHLDVKPGNIVFDSDSSRGFRNLKLLDFGSSMFMTEERPANTAGTYGCMAPERFDGRCGPEADVYGAGVVLYHMLVGEIPFTGNDGYQIMAKNMQGDVHFDHPRWRHVSVPLRHLAERMLAKDPDERITFAEILKLTWLFQTQSKQDLHTESPPFEGHLMQSTPFAFFA
ncbi:hypothetical protein Poli38472_006409 [Pythium oligandrum]|uniref:Protein kinase domain-containing protein n=1 Tax=Pythium oligandrum TaxID=41045 RepID=A0A8K1FD13_PYTOL|nr:hypothetical protein Poli38472_006409 [Pythium oligandrum]|eukprot:TMW56399.1 hypothetical protein Poli38472_006409 [Pythium oligandrum]